MSFADKVLNEKFFTEFGRFVANCGHLEKLIWINLTILRGLYLANDNDCAEIARMRKLPVGSLLLKYEEALSSSDRPEETLDEFKTFVADVSQDVEWRNMAIHSAWEAEGSQFRPHGFIKLAGGGDRKNIEDWLAYDNAITLDEIASASDVVSGYIERAGRLMKSLSPNRSDPPSSSP